ncbi:hypothetical protein [Kouleothrix sp.]|uniref:hypothetical protein n=1 Tax=Kouleothrix sp. TaxID=2779161 RepID=UPI00391BC928
MLSVRIMFKPGPAQTSETTLDVLMEPAALKQLAKDINNQNGFFVVFTAADSEGQPMREFVIRASEVLSIG